MPILNIPEINISLPRSVCTAPLTYSDFPHDKGKYGQISGTHPSYAPIRVIKSVYYRFQRVRTVTWKGVALIINNSWSKLSPKTEFSSEQPLFPGAQISRVPKFLFVEEANICACTVCVCVYVCVCGRSINLGEQATGGTMRASEKDRSGQHRC